MHEKVRSVVAALGLAAVVGLAQAGDNRIYNPSFEEENLAFGDRPEGWNPISAPAPQWVDASDPGAHVRTGSKAIMLPPSTNPGNRFMGWTTNVFLPDGSDLYDPDYTYLGGTVKVSGYYLVPAGQALANDTAGIKLEFRREPPNFSIYTAFEFAVPIAATNGQWQYFECEVTDAMMLAVGDWPPYATSVSILPFRWFPGDYGAGPLPTGQIFWDDLSMTQGDEPGPCNPADLAEPYGVLNFFDVQRFLSSFSAHNPEADLAPPIGTFDFFDVSTYLNYFSAGCQ